MTVAGTAAGTARAWGWVDHLVDGGTTPWADWTGTADAPDRPLPGAQHLEVLRRLNELGAPDRTRAEQLLTVSAAGRGHPELELVGADRGSRFGPRPVDPAAVPTGELLRVATAAIAQDLLALGAPPVGRVRRPRLFRTRFRLGGDPELTGPLRAQLAARGRPAGGRSVDLVVVLGASVDRMLVDAWTHRAFGPGVHPWRVWLDRLTREDRLPGDVDLLQHARRAERRVGARRVHVVVDPRHLAPLLGVGSPLAAPPAPAAHVPDLARRVSRVLGLTVTGPGRATLLRDRLRPLLAGAEGEPLALPPRHLAWAEARSERLVAGLRRAGYAVHGDVEALRPHRGSGAVAPDVTATLLLALRLLQRPLPHPPATGGPA